MSGAPRAAGGGGRKRPANVATGSAASPLVTRVYQEVREAIVSLKLAPGAAVSETSVSRRFGGSRTPVRSALERLEREGLLTTVDAGAKRRLVVAPLTASDMRQLFLMVGALNGVAARLAAQVPDERRRQLVEQLTAINEELRRAAREDQVDARSAEQLDTAFHRAYEVVTDAPRLILELDSLGARRTRYVRVYTEALVHAHNLRESVAEHEAVIEALAAGDPDLAEQRAAFNYRKALERYDRALTASGERGTWF